MSGGNSFYPACLNQLDWSRATTDCNAASQMQRKAAILQYKQNSSKLTKKQQYSQNIKGNGPLGKKTWATQSDTYTNPNTQNLTIAGNTLVVCSGSALICVPTSSSDVPGPIIDLCYDSTRPPINNSVRRTYTPAVPPPRPPPMTFSGGVSIPIQPPPPEQPTHTCAQ